MERESVVVCDPEILGGTPCFRGTRVPVDSLIDYIEAGDTLDAWREDPEVRILSDSATLEREAA